MPGFLSPRKGPKYSGINKGQRVPDRSKTAPTKPLVKCFLTLEKEMATHSSIVAWEIPWTEEPGGLQSMRLQRVGHDLATKTASVVGTHGWKTWCR